MGKLRVKESYIIASRVRELQRNGQSNIDLIRIKHLSERKKNIDKHLKFEKINKKLIKLRQFDPKQYLISLGRKC